MNWVMSASIWSRRSDKAVVSDTSQLPERNEQVGHPASCVALRASQVPHPGTSKTLPQAFIIDWSIRCQIPLLLKIMTASSAELVRHRVRPIRQQSARPTGEALYVQRRHYGARMDSLEHKVSPNWNWSNITEFQLRQTSFGFELCSILRSLLYQV